MEEAIEVVEVVELLEPTRVGMVSVASSRKMLDSKGIGRERFEMGETYSFDILASAAS